MSNFYTIGIEGPIAISAIIVSGINPESADFIDLGKTRNLKDVTFRRHYFDDVLVEKTVKDGKAMTPITPAQQNKIAGWVSTAAKIIYFRLWSGLKVRSSQKFTQSQYNEVMAAYPNLKDSAIKVYQLNELNKGSLARMINPAYLVALHYLATYSDSAMTGEFAVHADWMIECLANGQETEPGRPWYELREWLNAQINAKKDNQGLNRLYDAVVYAWVAYITGQSIPDRKVFSKLKADEFYHMGGLDTPPAQPVEDEVEETPVEETPVEEVPPAPVVARRPAPALPGAAAVAVAGTPVVR